MSNYREFTQELLIALVELADENDHGQVNPFEAADATGIAYNAPWVRDAIDTFKRRGLIRNVIEALGGVMIVTITGEAREQVEQILGSRPPKPPQPPAEAVVVIDHSSKDYTAASAALVQVTEALSATNDLPVALEEKERLMAEVEAGKALFRASRVRVEAAVSVLVKALRYIADKFVGQIVGTVAVAALTAVAALLGIHFQ